MTADVLRSIAYHIDSKRNRVAIVVSIAEYEDRCLISVLPDTNVYPNVHRRKSADLQRVQDHVIIEHFPNLIQSILLSGQVILKPHILIPGMYAYEFSFMQKQRRWRRIR